MAALSENTKAFLFARWISMCYADTKVDGISVLNLEKGQWYKEQLQHFNEVVYPNMKKSGTVTETRSFLNDLPNNIKYPEWKK